MPRCLKCKTDFPNRIKIDGKTKLLHNRKYCLSCSPYGLHNTKSLNKGEKTKHWCPKCEKTLPISEFYMRRNGLQPSPYCIRHTNQETVERQRKFKQRCVDYKGGACKKCGYNRCLAALHFHHRDPSQKEISISGLKSWIFESVIQELDKCDLLCANCHAEEHSN